MQERAGAAVIDGYSQSLCLEAGSIAVCGGAVERYDAFVAHGGLSYGGSSGSPCGAIFAGFYLETFYTLSFTDVLHHRYVAHGLGLIPGKCDCGACCTVIRSPVGINVTIGEISGLIGAVCPVGT